MKLTEGRLVVWGEWNEVCEGEGEGRKVDVLKRGIWKGRRFGEALEEGYIWVPRREARGVGRRGRWWWWGGERERRSLELREE